MQLRTAASMIPAAIGRLIRDQRGASMVEFAFVVPIALLLTIGAFEVARAISVQASINQAAKETARFASVRGSASGMAATEGELEAMALQLADLVDGSTAADVGWNPNNSPGSVVTVDMQTVFTPIALPFGPDSYTLTSTASMTIVR